MKNNELLKKYAGISTRIRRIFAYHYDQIQREVQTEISTLNPELQGQFRDLIVEYMEESINWPDPDDQYYDYSPSQVEAILFGILQLTKEHQDIIVTELKRQLKSFIQDKDQAEEMITRYTCIYNAIEKWELTHMDTKILHQLEVLNLLKHLSNN